MKLLEYQARQLFEKYDIPTMKGCVIDSPEKIPEKISAANLRYPVVVKAQVQVGGRGKAGGIQFADDGRQAAEKAAELLHKDIREFKANELLIAEKASPVKEWYLSIILDRLSKAPLIIFSPCGGMDIEETSKVNPDAIAKVVVNPLIGVKDYVVGYLMDKTGADKQYRSQLKDIIEKLYKIFFAYNTLLAEINPLAIDAGGKLTALDGKIDVDDSALYKLPDISAFRDKLQEDALVVKARSFDFLYIPVEEDGDIGVLSNGSGMIMSCIDLISKKGMKVAASLDLGGGATSGRIKEAVRILLSNQRINALMICIFGGITRCDEVAEGVRLALAEHESNKTVIFRMEGTNKEKGLEIIRRIPGQVVPAESIPHSVEILAEKRGL